jgi:myo-inositol-1(or 4)-monophosphatase
VSFSTSGAQEERDLSRHLLQIAERAAREAGQYVVGRAGNGIAIDEKAGFFDPVTECDRQSERLIAERIFREHPDSTLLGEEGGRQGTGSVHWYVDPIDGTNNFVSGIPFFCVSIAAALGDTMLAGAIYDPNRDEMMAASLDGAFLNGRPIRSKGKVVESQSTVMTSFPRSGGRATADDWTYLSKLSDRFRSVRRMGSAALELAYVACGRAEVTFQVAVNAWDVAAGMLLVRQAGGRYFVPRRSAERPWLSPQFIAACPEFDLERSVIREIVDADMLIGTGAGSAAAT